MSANEIVALALRGPFDRSSISRRPAVRMSLAAGQATPKQSAYLPPFPCAADWCLIVFGTKAHAEALRGEIAEVLTTMGLRLREAARGNGPVESPAPRLGSTSPDRAVRDEL